MMRCRSCKAVIEWRLTSGGKRAPFNAGTDTSHFVTCPQSAKWKKKPTGPKPFARPLSPQRELPL